MKIQLDTDKQTIKVEETVNLNDLFVFLNKILPNNEWHTYSIETNVTINWSNPIIINNPITYPINPVPIIPNCPDPRQPWITYLSADETKSQNDYTINSGVYNIDVKA